MTAKKQPDHQSASVIGLELAGVVALLAFAGYGIDRWLGTAPWATLSGAMIGIVGEMIKLVLLANRMNRKK